MSEEDFFYYQYEQWQDHLSSFDISELKQVVDGSLMLDFINHYESSLKSIPAPIAITEDDDKFLHSFLN